MRNPAVLVAEVTHAYGRTVALNAVTLEIARGQLTGLLGPNGSGKTTLFRLLATLMPVQSGTISVLGHDVMKEPAAVRGRLGVTFQSPALDSRLTVFENLQCHGRLFGIDRQTLNRRIDESLQQLDLADRRSSRVEQLSGGLRRRTELAKGLLHQPDVLLLDEPSTGLDLMVRRRFWDTLDAIRKNAKTTVVVSTHLMDEAERCDQLFLLHEGRLVASGAPAELQQHVAGERVTVRLRDIDDSRPAIQALLGEPATVQGNQMTFHVSDAAAKVQHLLDGTSNNVLSVEVAQATLDDVFLDATGRSLAE